MASPADSPVLGVFGRNWLELLESSTTSQAEGIRNSNPHGQQLRSTFSPVNHVDLRSENDTDGDQSNSNTQETSRASVNKLSCQGVWALAQEMRWCKRAIPVLYAESDPAPKRVCFDWNQPRSFHFEQIIE